MPQHRPETEVFTVGGGPAGLAAALAVKRAGFDVIVADCSHPPIDKACGEGIMPDGLSALQQHRSALGVCRNYRPINLDYFLVIVAIRQPNPRQLSVNWHLILQL